MHRVVKGILFCVSVVALCAVGYAQEEKVLRSSVAHVTRLAFTESLPEADRIELFTFAVELESKLPPNEKPKPEQMSKDKFLLRSFDGSLRETENPYIDVDEHVTIKADRCKEIVATWRKLKFRPNGAFCHAPPYGVRFYKDDQLLFETTICWKCHNFYIPDYDPETGEIKMVIYGFDDNANSRKLLNLFSGHYRSNPKRKPTNRRNNGMQTKPSIGRFDLCRVPLGLADPSRSSI